MSSNDPKTHTPGPWSLDRFGKVITPHGNLLATGIALPCGNHPDAKEAEANTRLIAAAPDLLAALKTLLRPYGVADIGCARADVSVQCDFYDALLRARAAIAKADPNATIPD